MPATAAATPFTAPIRSPGPREGPALPIRRADPDTHSDWALRRSALLPLTLMDGPPPHMLAEAGHVAESDCNWRMKRCCAPSSAPSLRRAETVASAELHFVRL